jgi:hypothetical protein
MINAVPDAETMSYLKLLASIHLLSLIVKTFD